MYLALPAPDLSEGVLKVGPDQGLFVRARAGTVPPLPGDSLAGSLRAEGTLAGNVANASPIADTLPFLFVMEASLELTGRSGTRTVPIREFFLSFGDLGLVVWTLVKILAWYDNEWGYVNRTVELVRLVGAAG